MSPFEPHRHSAYPVLFFSPGRTCRQLRSSPPQMIPRISLGFPDFSWGCRRGGGAVAVYRARSPPNLCRVWHGILQSPLHAAACPTRARGTWPQTSGIQPGVSAVAGPPPRVAGHAAHRTHAIAGSALCMRRCARHQPRPGARTREAKCRIDDSVSLTNVPSRFPSKTIFRRSRFTHAFCKSRL